MSTEPDAADQLRLTVTASFTAEPLEAALTFWARQLGLPLSLRFAPSGQVLTQLLDPGSTLAGNPDGINLVLVRLADFRPAGTHEPGERELAELAAALRAAATTQGSGRLLLAVCPDPPDRPNGASAWPRQPDRVGSLLASVATSPAIHVLDPELAAARYPAPDYADEFAYQLGQVPYTPTYFAALGTALVREIQAIHTPRPKLLVVDCDQTLWDGVVGEDGPDRVRIGPDRRELQQLLVDQHDAGRLICLCSKNIPADVWAVFDRHPDAPLTRAHLAGARINWQPKSANVRELAAELGVALDSVVFLDDNPVECAELRAALPAVLALPVPAQADAAVRFLRHVWPLDAPEVTVDDRRRTARYHQERQRRAWREQAPTLAEFLAGLRLAVTIRPLRADDAAEVARAAQLTQRTNQFNLATTRHTAAELAADPARWWVVTVGDRFGEYGLTGLIGAAVVGGALVVDGLLLSCRVLGRGVEHRVLAHLGKLARDRGVATVKLAYRPTDRNQVARDFLAGLARAPAREEGGTWWYAVPADTAAAATPTPAAPPTPTPLQSPPESPGLAPADRTAEPDLVARIATSLAAPAQMLAAIEADRIARRSSRRPVRGSPARSKRRSPSCGPSCCGAAPPRPPTTSSRSAASRCRWCSSWPGYGSGSASSCRWTCCSRPPSRSRTQPPRSRSTSSTRSPGTWTRCRRRRPSSCWMRSSGSPTRRSTRCSPPRTSQVAYAILLTHGTNGDVLPFLHLAEVLRGRGHEVTLVTHAPYGPAARASGVEFVPLDTAEQYAHYLADARTVLLSRLGSPEPPDLLAHYHRTGLFDQIRTEIAAVVRRHRPGRTVLVGRHTSGLAALIAAEALRIPAAWLAPTPAQHLLLPVTEYLHRTVLAPELNRIRGEYGLPPVPDWRAWLASADRQLGLWPGWFDAAGTPTPEPVTKVGFLLGEGAESGELPAELLPVLDAGRPPVLIAGSSGSILFEQFYRAAATACRRVGRAGILVSPFPELLPDRLPPDLHWFPRLPYRQLMPRVAAVIHHGGIGTLARALAAGVPQLVLAHSFDQPDTAARLRRLGAAEWLPSTHWDPERAGELLARLLTDPSYRERGARLGRRIDPARAARAAAAQIERLLSPSV